MNKLIFSLILGLTATTQVQARELPDEKCTDYYVKASSHLGDRLAAGFFTTVVSTGWLTPVGAVVVTDGLVWQPMVNRIAATLVEAEAGRGPELYSLLTILQGRLKTQVSIQEVAQAVNSLNQRKAFCNSEGFNGEFFITTGNFVELVAAEVMYNKGQ